MLYEDGSPESTAKVDRCEEPRHFALTAQGRFSVSYEVSLEQSGDTTVMTFVHRLTDRKMARRLRARLGFYLELFVHSREGKPFRKFEEYYPSQKQYYLDLALDA